VLDGMRVRHARKSKAEVEPHPIEESAPLLDPDEGEAYGVDVDMGASSASPPPPAPNRTPRQRNEAVRKERSFWNLALDWVCARARIVRVCFLARGAESSVGQHATDIVPEGSSPQEVEESMARTSRDECTLVCSDAHCSGKAYKFVVECKECGQARCATHDWQAHMYLHQHRRSISGRSMPARALQPEELLVENPRELESASDGNGPVSGCAPCPFQSATHLTAALRVADHSRQTRAHPSRLSPTAVGLFADLRLGASDWLHIPVPARALPAGAATGTTPVGTRILAQMT